MNSTTGCELKPGSQYLLKAFWPRLSFLELNKSMLCNSVQSSSPSQLNKVTDSSNANRYDRYVFDIIFFISKKLNQKFYFLEVRLQFHKLLRLLFHKKV